MLNETEPYQASQGWTLREAFQRTTDPVRLQAWITARAAIPPQTPVPNELKVPSWVSPFADSEWIERQRRRQAGWRKTVDEKRNDQIREASTLERDLTNEFRHHLLAGHLIAKASRGGASVAPSEIFPVGWEGLRIVSWDKSIAAERSGEKKKLFGVRIFPSIYASAAPAELDGLNLAEAFKKFVLADPEVIAAGKRVMETTRHDDCAAVFRDGRAPGPIIQFRWPLDIPPRDLAYEFVRRVAWNLDDPVPVPTNEMINAATILMDRISALKKLLTSGRVVAQGTFATSGVVTPIDRQQWARTNLLIDVHDSDLLVDEGGKPTPRWTGVSFELPRHHADDRRELPSSDDRKSARRSDKRVETTTIASNECLAWLIAEMSKSPATRPEPKAAWWEQALLNWPGRLSRRTFDRNWSEAARKANAPAWCAAGAPRKMTATTPK